MKTLSEASDFACCAAAGVEPTAALRNRPLTAAAMRFLTTIPDPFTWGVSDVVPCHRGMTDDCRERLRRRLVGPNWDQGCRVGWAGPARTGEPPSRFE